MKASFRKRFFASMLKKGDAFSHKLYGPYKKELFKNIQGLVVEIGPGTGVNFDYFPSHINWIGIELNEAFYEVLQQQAKQREIQPQILKGEPLHIPLPDNSADFFLSTLVLCSVHDPAKVIAEIKRVLKPGGKLIFIEHVAAPKQTGLRLLQNIFNPVNRIIADGCNCNRETWTFIQEAGFTELKLLHHQMKGAFKFFSPHIMGYAIK
jgi:ubiquinone/menaquinone biosynthesis C-methylase UbiE